MNGPSMEPREYENFPTGSLDRAMALLCEARLSVVILWEAGRYKLVDAEDIPFSQIVESGYATPAQRFVGVVGVIDGISRAVLVEPMAEEDIGRLSAIYTRYLGFVVRQALREIPNPSIPPVLN